MSFVLFPDIIEHQQRVAKLARDFALFLGIRKSEAQQLFLASLFHDVGKSKISPEILNKPSKLTKEEMDIVKTHPVESVNILSYLKLSDQILDIVLYHHESYDGSGYPEGLKGEDIPYMARILKICDVFDALTNSRCYRPFAYSEAQSIAIMTENINEFDPELFNYFKNFLDYQRYEEKEAL